MRIVGCEILHCNAGWRDFSFLKLMTDENITGISEYNECYGSPGLSGIIRRLVERIKDMDPLAHEHIHQCLYAATRQAPGGVNQQAIARPASPRFYVSAARSILHQPWGN